MGEIDREGECALAMLSLYPFQSELVEKVEAAYARGVRSVLLQCPTGGGKTHIASALIQRARARGESAVFFAHRREIVRQTADRLAGCGMHPEILMAGFAPDPWADVRVASIDTVWARRMGLGFPDADLFVVDECHRVADKNRYGKLIHHHLERGGRVLGLTATPIRMDGQGLAKLFDEMVCSPPIEWLIENQYLVSVDYRIGMVPDKKGWKVIAATNDYSQKSVEPVMMDRKLVGNIVENWLFWAKGRPTIVFAHGVNHSIMIAQMFEAVGVRAMHIDGTTESEVRDRVYQMSRSGEIEVITNDSVYVEGTDFPWISCIVDARPTKSLTRYMQAGGRGLRKWEGKSSLLYLDHSGNVSEHGRIEMHRDWELTEGREAAEKLQAARRKMEPKQVSCPQCGYLMKSSKCYMCGYEFPKYGKDKPVISGILIPIEDAQKKDRPKKKKDLLKGTNRHLRQLWYSGLLQIAEQRGYKFGWAVHKFEERFGILPWKDNLEKIPGPPLEETLRWVKHTQIRWAKSKRKEAAAG